MKKLLGLIVLIFSFIVSYFYFHCNIQQSIKIGCAISIGTFLIDTFLISKELLTYQLTKIISYLKISEFKGKWNISNTIESIIMFGYIFIEWVNLIICSMVIYLDNEKFWICVFLFLLSVMISLFYEIMFLFFSIKK